MRIIAIKSALSCAAIIAGSTYTYAYQDALPGQLQPPISEKPGISLPKMPIEGKEDYLSDSRRIQSRGIIVTWPETNDELRAFSVQSGKWEILPIERQEAIIPIVEDSAIAVRLKKGCAAFGVPGGWDLLELPEDCKAVPVLEGEGLVVIQTESHLYTFSSQAGQWSSPTDPDLKEVMKTYRIKSKTPAGSTGDVLRISGIEKTIWASFQKWIESLPKYQARRIRANFASGNVELVAGTQSAFKQAYNKLTELCELEETGSEVAYIARYPLRNIDLKGAYEVVSQLLGGATDVLLTKDDRSHTLILMAGKAQHEMVSELLKKLDVEQRPPTSNKSAQGDPSQKQSQNVDVARVKEEENRRLADIRNSQNVLKAKKSEVEQLQKQLDQAQAALNAFTDKEKSSNYTPEKARVLAEDAFQFSQDLYRAEATLLRQKLQLIDATIASREANREKIIGSNMLQWVTDKSSTQTSPQSSTPEIVNRQLKQNNLLLAQDLRFVEQVSMIASGLRQRRTAWLQAREQALPHERLIKSYSRPIDELKAEGVISQDTSQKDLEEQIARSKPALDNWSPEAENRLKAWRQVWSAYDSQVKLVESNLQLAQARLTQTKQLVDKGLVSQSELLTLELNLKNAVDIDKAFKNILEIEPELDPDNKANDQFRSLMNK